MTTLAARGVGTMTFGYLRLELRRLLRDRAYLFGSMLLPTVMYLLFTNIGGLTGQSRQAAALYSMIGLAAFAAIGAVLNNGGQIVEERTGGWLRQLRTTPMPPAMVVAVRAATAMVVALPCIAVICLAGTVINGVQLDAGQWVRILAQLWLGVIPFALLGLAVGHAATPRTLPLYNMAAYLAMSVVGGLWMPISVFPAWLQAIGRVLPTHAYQDMSWRIVLGSAPSIGDVAVLAAWMAVFGAWAAAAYRRSGRAR